MKARKRLRAFMGCFRVIISRMREYTCFRENIRMDWRPRHLHIINPYISRHTMFCRLYFNIPEMVPKIRRIANIMIVK